MSFPFGSVCELLNKLERNHTKFLKTDKVLDRDARTVIAWFNKCSGNIPRQGSAAVAFLSCLFPERRPDRVYTLREKRLEAIVQQAQCLGSSRLKDLQNWRTNDGMDFASCVERVMSATDSEPRHGPSVTVEELDETLDRIAATSSFSSVNLRRRVKEKHAEPIRTDDALSGIFRVLNGSEAKWMVRMLLKNYGPVHIPETLAMQQFHFLLPDLLSFQNSFDTAVKFLQDPLLGEMPARVGKEDEDRLRESAVRRLVPQIGVMIRRPPHEKARSIKHCCRLADRRRMSVERKYNGEYCQVHIDLARGTDCIQIFSKSGKDSTNDRIGLHRALRDSLRLEHDDCKIEKQCILEGELLVWSDDEKRIEPFHKIRKYVKRSGRLIGTARDSPVDSNEHLMIMFFDILLLDDTVYIRVPHDKRRQLLQSLVHCIPGQADIGSREIIDFSSYDGPERLSEAFARAITRRWEGFVLKGCNDLYVSFNQIRSSIKLKKDYIAGLGDTADMIIVGGRRDARDEQELGIGKLWWTSFYIGCLENKDDVRRFDAKPRFRIIDVVDRYAISKANILYLNRHGYFDRAPFVKSLPGFDVGLGHGQQLQPAELFKRPFIVELMGAGFDRPANARYFTLRFPRVLKIHEDRSFSDTIGFEELQEMARQCGEVPEDGAREDVHSLSRLRKFDYLIEASRSGSPSDDFNTAAVTETTGIDSYRAALEVEKKAEIGLGSSAGISLCSSKRKMASEISPQGDLAIKRAKQEGRE